MLTGRKLTLAFAFAGLGALAVGAGCRGFFVKPTVTSVAVSPPTPTIALTQSSGAAGTQQFTAIASFSDNSPPSATPATWNSSQPTTVASIDSTTGLATAIGAGTATITAISTRFPSISGTTTLTVVPANVTSITVTPSTQSTTTGSTIFLKAVDQNQNDLSASVTWTFTLQGTSTVETGITKTSVLDPTQGQQFQVNTLTPPAASFPVTLNVVASLTVGGKTVSSSSTAVTVTITG